MKPKNGNGQKLPLPSLWQAINSNRQIKRYGVQQMQKVRMTRGYRFRVAGMPSNKLTRLSDPRKVAFLPERIPNIKPKVKVSEGDQVKIGSVLFHDKRNPRLHFLSPGGGTVDRIQYGPRRKLEAIVIARDEAEEPRICFPAISSDALKKMNHVQIVAHILQGGLWWVFRQLPFRTIPDPDSVPPMILVSLSAKEPFQPRPSVYLQDRMDLLTYGLQALNTLANGRVMVLADADDHILLDQCGSLLTHQLQGEYPADDPGTIVYYTKKSADQNRAWFISGQDLLLVSQLLAQGQYPVERIFSVAGSHSAERQHFRARFGSPLSHLTQHSPIGSDVRMVVGGLLTGYTGTPSGFMGPYETALNLVPQGAQAEFLELFKPGLSKPTYSRTFLSRLNPKRLRCDCNLHGGRRACIACMHCADICPVNIMVHLAYKAILAEEVEEYLELGLLDCVECGLCSYVCPSKIELSQTLKTAKTAHYLEACKDNTP
jgi:Na+-transporting NADH:ubiquinone oxidoreductase subunit A